MIAKGHLRLFFSSAEECHLTMARDTQGMEATQSMEEPQGTEETQGIGTEETAEDTQGLMACEVDMVEMAMIAAMQVTMGAEDTQRLMPTVIHMPAEDRGPGLMV
mmetsp:Transcript_113268/g.200842  ORF Transcript_113268/g.200842 Transcript_113268/m.200842 type:complete len:105 (-) Transcript_113268:79-393(-)